MTMAAGVLPKPGTKYGPCRGKCKHIDCKRTRTEAASLCSFCHQPIGYGVRYYRSSAGLDHAACAEDTEERRRLAQPVTLTVKRGIAEYWLDQCDAEIVFWESVAADPLRQDEGATDMIADWKATKQSIIAATTVSSRSRSESADAGH